MRKRIRRDVNEWASVPRDGTPVHILNTVRFNPLAKRWECLIREDDGTSQWAPANLESDERGPSKWLGMVPLPYEVPTSFAWTVAYEVRPKRLIDRLWLRLFGTLRRWQFKPAIASMTKAVTQ